MLIFRLGTVFCTLQVSFFNPEEKKNEQKVVLKKHHARILIQWHTKSKTR